MEPASLYKLLEPILYIVFFLIAFGLAQSAWLYWRQVGYKGRVHWTIMEIRVPREVLRGAKAMDQFLTSLWGLLNLRWGVKETWFDGEITRWFCFELVGSNQMTRLFVRFPTPLKHMFISMFFAAYPEVELMECDDYVNELPPTYAELKERNMELYGLEIYTKKADAYPIQSYNDYEKPTGDEKGRILDPIASVLEIVSKLKPEETIWVQLLCAPDVIGDWSWKPEAVKILDKFKNPVDEAHSGGTGAIRFRFRSPGEDEVIKRIDDKKSKLCFETIIRMLYVAPKSIYNHNTLYRGIFGFFQQFKNEYQIFKKNFPTRTKSEWFLFPFVFPARRLKWKRKVLFDEYRRRFFPEETLMGRIANSHLLNWCFFHHTSIFSAEELATMFHIPTNVVLTQSAMERIESKRLPSPSNLPS